MSAVDAASRSVAATPGGVGGRCSGIAVTPDGDEVRRRGRALRRAGADAKDVAAYLETLR